MRGADGACWTFDPGNSVAGWRSLGGRFSDGFGVISNADDTETTVIGRGLNHRLYTANPDNPQSHWFPYEFI